MKKIVLAAATVLATLGTAHAQTYPAPMQEPAPRPVRFLVGMGLSGGGDKLATAHYTDGTDVNLHAGGLVYLTGGIDYHVTPQFSLQGTINYHVDQANARNGDVQFERFPIELIAYYQPFPAWRVGGGVRYVTSAKLSSSGAVAGYDTSFENTTSAVIETEWFPSQQVGIKLRYVNEKYKDKAHYFEDVDGSHVGVSANFYF